MRSPFSPLQFFLVLALILWLIFAINLELIALTLAKLGLEPSSALLLLMTSLFGSALNLPLMTLPATEPPERPEPMTYRGLLRPPEILFSGKTLVAVNVGGCLVPLFFSLFLLRHYSLPVTPLLEAVLIVTAVSYFASRPVSGLGVAMPILVAPLTAALAGVLLGGEHRAPVAYIAGTLGVLIGADLLRLKDIRKLGAPVASIGGAGTFDGIFMTGLVAVLLT